MQVLALNGSPRLETSNSQRMLAPLLDGMREAGAEVTQHYLAQLEINHCTGCYGCWMRTPGKCATWRDGMDLLLPQVVAADYLVASFPLYVYTMPARVKAFMERLLPTAEPWITLSSAKPGHAASPGRRAQRRKLVVLCSAGLFEREHFEPLRVTFDYMASMSGQPSPAMIFRPAAGLLQAPQFQEALAPYYAALKQAGRELVQDGAITAATQAALDKDLLPVTAEQYYSHINAHVQQKLAEQGLDSTPPPGAPMPPSAG
jgi:putative NADPH-quinone reductase